MRAWASVYPSLTVNFVRDGLGPTDELPGLPPKPAIGINEPGVTSAIQVRHEFAVIKHWESHS